MALPCCPVSVLGTEEREQYAREEDEEGGLREPLLQNGTDAEERGGGGDWRSDDLEVRVASLCRYNV
eukprot:1157745-Pelagomonas_calceolata.AAC.11